jgi:hypothetical protein
MTFYYRSPQERPAPVRSGFAIRLASSLALLAYPAGCLSLLFAPDAAAGPAGMIGALAWLALLLTSLGAFVYLAPSYQQRIVGEQADKLDEFELQLRQRAYAFSYKVFTGLCLVGLIYLAISLDVADSGRFGLWRPSSFDHWNAIIWGAILYAFILPTAYIAWTVKAPRLDAH